MGEGKIVRPGDTRWPDTHRPWYLRDQDVLPSSLFSHSNFPSGSWQNHANLTTALYAFEEASRWTVHGEGSFKAEAVHAFWIQVGLRVEYNLNGAGWATLAVNPQRMSFLYASAGHNAEQQFVTHSWRWPFTFVGPSDTIQFRVGYYGSGSAIKFWRVMLYVDVDRVG